MDAKKTVTDEQIAEVLVDADQPTEEKSAVEEAHWQTDRERVMHKDLTVMARAENMTLYGEIDKDWLFWIGLGKDGNSVFAKVRPENFRECYDDDRWTWKSDEWNPPMSKEELAKIAADKAAAEAAEKATQQAHAIIRGRLADMGWTEDQISAFFSPTE